MFGGEVVGKCVSSFFFKSHIFKQFTSHVLPEEELKDSSLFVKVLDAVSAGHLCLQLLLRTC